MGSSDTQVNPHHLWQLTSASHHLASPHATILVPLSPLDTQHVWMQCPEPWQQALPGNRLLPHLQHQAPRLLSIRVVHRTRYQGVQHTSLLKASDNDS